MDARAKLGKEKGEEVAWLETESANTLFGPVPVTVGVDADGKGRVKVRVGGMPPPEGGTFARAALVGAVNIIGRMIEKEAGGTFDKQQPQKGMFMKFLDNVRDKPPQARKLLSQAPTFTLPGYVTAHDKQVTAIDTVQKAIHMVGAWSWFQAHVDDGTRTNFVVLASEITRIPETVKDAAEKLERYLRIRSSGVHWGVQVEGEALFRVYQHPVNDVTKYQVARFATNDRWYIVKAT